MSCNEHFRNMIHPYELGMLSDEERRLFETHLLECKDCFETVRQFESTADIIRNHDLIKRTVLHSRPTGRKTVLRTLLIAAVLLVVIGPTIYFLDLSDRQAKNVQTIDLAPFRGDSPRLISAAQGGDVEIRFYIDSSTIHDTVRVTITKRGGAALFEDTAFHFIDSSGIGVITLPVDRFEPGRYVLEVRNRSITDTIPLHRYNFRVE